MRNVIIVVVILSALLAFAEISRGDDSGWRVFMEHGGMNVDENGISEGHKSYHQFGIEGYAENMRARVAGQIDGFFRGEPAEEDPEIPSWGLGAQVEYGYKIREWAIPYLGVRYDHIERGIAPKYSDPSDPEYNAGYVGQVESEHDIVSARGGFHFRKDWFWLDLGTIIPFYTSTKSGNFGPDVGVGVKFGRWDVGYRFKQIVMTDNHFSGDVALSLYWSGVQLGYSF